VPGVLARVELTAKSQELKAVVEKKTNRRDHPGGCFLSNALLQNAGGAGVSTDTLGTIFSANFARSFAISAVKSF